MKLRVYLDTSVLSALLDDRVPERQAQTEEFFKRISEFQPSVSSVTRQELEMMDLPKRESLLQRCDTFDMLRVTAEAQELANIYMFEGVFTPSMANDALHVAVAVVSRQDILVSWNFRHLVNRRRRALVNSINIRRGFPTIEILAPPEV